MTPTKEQLGSPIWRLRNLYSIMSKSASGDDAGIIPFSPTAEQEELIQAVYVKKWEFIVVVKSRQLGLSTIVCLIILDALLFGSGIQASIVDQTADDAKKKLDQKIKMAFESLPAWLRSGWEVVNSNDTEFIVKLQGKDKSDERTCFAGLRARGGTNHILFVSEWGEIQLKDKRRSLEILTGAIPSADHHGCVTIAETTWKGGKSGELWPYVSQAMQTPEHKKGPKDPRVLFFGWYTSPHNRDDGSPDIITAKTHDYFDTLEKTLAPRKFDNGQRLWWQKRKATFGIMMSSEHPSTLEEALESPHQSAFFDTAGIAYQTNTAISLEPYIEWGEVTENEGTKAVFWRATPEAQAIFRMWGRPDPKESYLIAADSRVGRQALGATGALDSHSYSVWRAGRTCRETGRVYLPMRVMMCKIPDQCGTVEMIRRVRLMHLFYGGCMVVPEINNKDDLALRMQAAGIGRIWTQRAGEDGAMPGTTRKQEILGWCTTGTTGGTRKQILDNMQELVLQQGFIGSCRTFAHQMSVFVRNEKGIPAAAEGEHDDTVMETAIALFCLPSATPYVPIGQQAAAKQGPGGWRDVFTEGDG